MKGRLLGMLVGIGLLFVGGAATVAPTEAAAQSYRTDRAIARSQVRRAGVRRAYRAQARRDVRRAGVRRAYRADRRARAYRAGAYRADRRARARAYRRRY